MTPSRSFRPAAALLAALALAAPLAAGGPGCGPSHAHAPSAGDARKALDAALDAWAKGQKPDALEKAEPPVHVADAQWQSGAALQSFTVDGEEPEQAGDPARRFAVSLTLKGAKAGVTTKTRYVVLGNAPVWVYREDDYNRLLNMDNNPRPAARKR